MALKPKTTSEHITGFVTLLLRVALVIAGVISLLHANWSALFASVATLGLSYLPKVLASQANVRLPLQFEFAIVVFLYASLFLGEVGDYYERFWWWDSVLHTGSAFAFGFAGFLILYILSARKKLAASPAVISFFAFAFGLAIGALWEIFEFAADQLFGLNMQKSGLRDTMGDLIVDAVGAGVASLIGYIYLKFQVRDPFDVFIDWFAKANPHLGVKQPASASKKAARR